MGVLAIQVRKMARCAMLAALLAVCAWLAIPVGEIAITGQTFGVFLTLGLLGARWGGLSIGVYLLLGAAGAPVFALFQGGLGVLLGPGGGFLWGFLVSAGVYGLCVTLLGKKWGSGLGMVLGQLACYGCGCAWYAFGYLSGGQLSLGAVLFKCVVPYLIPDMLKLAAAWTLTQRLKRNPSAL